MEFRILGPLEVIEAGERLPLGGSKQRALLALLVLNAERVIPSDRLIDALWGELAPEGAAHTLQVYISQLRKTLRTSETQSSNSVLVTEGRGYALRTRDVDLYRFEEAVELGRKALAEGAPDRAARVLREALELWRGPVLEEFAFEPFAQPEITRIEEHRVSAIEDRIEADLALGRHAELVGELRALVAEHPLRERLWGQLMLALYRSGRQAESLQAYQEARRMLAEELGIDPSPELRRLEDRILRQAPELDVHRPPPSSDEIPTPSTTSWPSGAGAARARRIGWPAILTAAVTVLVIVLAATAVVIRARSEDEGPSFVGADSIARIDPGANKVVGAVTTTGADPTALVWYEGSLWAANTVSRTIARIDPDSNTVVHAIPTGGAPTDLAAGLGAVWVLNGLDGSLLAIDPSTNQIKASFEVPVGAGGIAIDSRTVWVTDGLHAQIAMINPTTGDLVSTIDLGGDGTARPQAIVVAGDVAWVADELGRSVWEIEVETGQIVASPGLRAPPTHIAVDETGTAWVTGFDADIVSFIDPETLRATTVSVGHGPMGVAVSEEAIWVANSLDGTLSRIDPDSGEVQSIAIGAGVDDVAVGGGSVWVSVNA
jgi:DNA-binding SARP family transcriptional activator/DNA-binding beta-propeller fold protein YncE